MHTMRKLFALALLALALAYVAVGCGKKAEETPAATESSSMMSDTMSMDTMGTMSTMPSDTMKTKTH